MGDGGLTLGDYSRAWLTRVRVHPRTRKGYGHALKTLFRYTPSLKTTPLRALHRKTIRAGLEAILVAGLKSNTVRNSLIAVSACLAAAIDDELLTENPARGAGRRLFGRGTETGQSRALTRPQLTRFLDAVDIVAPQFRDVFLVLIFAGLRIGEALALQPDDVDTSRCQLHVRRQWVGCAIDLPKFGRIRTVDLSSDLTALLARRIAAVPEHLWLFQSINRKRPQPVNQKTIQDAMRRVCRAARLPPTTPHALRHTYGVMLLEATGDLKYAQNQLGHRHIATTADLYGASARPEHRAILDRLALLHRPAHRVEPAVKRPA